MSSSPNSSGTTANLMKAHVDSKPMTEIIAAFHQTPKYYNCDRCSASFRFLGCLKRHIVLPHDINRYACRRCPMIFISAFQYSKHLKNVHKPQEVQNTLAPAGTTDGHQWILEIMKNAGHPICPITNAQLLKDMEDDEVFFRCHPRLSASLQAEFDKMPEDQQLLGFTEAMNDQIEKVLRQDRKGKATIPTSTNKESEYGI